VSHYTKVKTKLRNAAAIMKALQDMGFERSMIQQHEQAVALEGYRGDKRKDRAEIVIPRRFVGGASNDIGFKLQEDGSYEAIISEYDSHSGCARKSKYHDEHGYNAKWLKKLNQRYAYHNLKEELSDQGFFIEAENEEDGQIFLECGTHMFGG